MQEDSKQSGVRGLAETMLSAPLPLPRSYLNYAGRKLLALTQELHGLGAFALITLGVVVSNFGLKRRFMGPLIRSQIARAGLGLLPMVSFISIALGMIIVAQTVYLLNRVGAKNLVGTVMVTVVVRELGPLVTALLVLTRVGAAAVIELGTARALGEVEALEALGIDPVHFLVAPRVFGMALSIFALTIYSLAIALASGYLFAFLHDVPLKPSDYFGQLADALRWEDFILLTAKTCGFGALIAVVTCYQGLAQPLALEDLAGATTRAVSHSIIGCVIVDVVMIIIYLLL